MNPKTPSDDESDEITSLVVKSSHELSTRASLVTRGLRDIADLLRSHSLKATQDQAWDLHKQRRFAEAVAVCSAGFEIDPTDEILWQIMGVGLAEQGRNEEGLACLERALQIDATNQYCWVLKAHLLRRLNRTEEQLESWRRVLGIEPDFQGAWKNVGRCLFDLGRYKDAVQAFDSEMRLNPLDEDCRSRRETALAEIVHNPEDPLSKQQLPDWNATGKCCPKDQARLLFCLDHQCTHDLCPDVPHLDFALIPVENVRPEVLQRSIQEGQAAGEYYVVHNGTGWHVLEDGEVGWDPESLPDGTVLLKTPEPLRGQLRGPFSKREAQNFVEQKKWRHHDQIVRLPRIVPHLWVSPDSDDAADGFAVGCSYCGASDPAQERNPCPKRSSYTWYEVLGVLEGADENQIVSAYRELVNEWDPKRLQSRDDIFLDCGYSETQIKWFNAAYAVLSDPVERRQYDAELLRQRRPNPESLAKQTEFSGERLDDAEEWTNKGNLLDANGNHLEALECHEKALTIDPLCVPAWINKGLCLDELGKRHEAIDSYERAIEIDRSNYGAWVRKGDISDRMGRFEEAIRCYDVALQLSPESISSWMGRGAALHHLGRYEEALSCYDTVLTIDRATWTDYGRAHVYSDALNSKGASLYRMGHYHDSIECYDKAIALDPEYAQPCYNKANILRKMEQFDEAIRCYDRASEIDPAHAGTWNNKGICLRKLGRLGEALVCHEKAVACNPPEVLGWYNKALVQEDLGRIQNAVSSYENYLAAATTYADHEIEHARERLHILKSAKTDSSG